MPHNALRENHYKVCVISDCSVQVMYFVILVAVSYKWEHTIKRLYNFIFNLTIFHGHLSMSTRSSYTLKKITICHLKYATLE